MSESAEIQPAVLDVHQSSAYLSVSAQTVRRMIRRGEIPHARIGNSIRIARTDLDAYIASRTTTEWKPADGRGQSAACV